MPPSSPFVPAAQTVASQVQLALGLARDNRRREAIALLRGVLAREPGQHAVRGLLAVMLQEAGEHRAALAELDQATALAPSQAMLHEARAGVLLALARPEEAERAARSALALDPQLPRALLALGQALDAQRRGKEAAATLRRLLASQPDHALARRVLARALLREHDPDGALAAVLHPSLIGDETRAREVVDEFCLNAAQPQAVALLQALLEDDPHNYAWIILMARVLHQAGRSSEAMAWSERAHRLRPDAAEPFEMRAVSLIDRGEVTAGLALYRSLLARGDATAETAARHLILAHYDPALDNDALFAAHAQWARDHLRVFGPAFQPGGTRDPARRLRVAWLSPRFSNGPVASFLTGLLAAFDREHFAHTLVALQRIGDETSPRLRELADDWQSLHDLDDADLLQRLRDCSFDIVVDLAGHSAGNRLPVLARRVAPIQVCWLDYFDTTAVPAMDVWISDAWLTPEDSTQRFSERVLRLRSGRFCYTPPAQAAEPGRIGAGPPVFASFNRPAKLNDDVLDAWAAILHRVPQARLELGAGLLRDAAARARTLERFAARGIDADRLGLQAERSYAELLAAYRAVDIALDPFPFSGCATTCDALWMGVPVIALNGEAFVSRQSASLLCRIGREAWVARGRADYVELAVALAGKVDAVRAGRHMLRDLVLQRLCDADAQAHEFAALLRELWREHCALSGN